MAGALVAYKKSYKDFAEIREQTWTEMMDDR